MTTDKASKRPTHFIYAVTRHGDAATWTRIGAAWTNGKGFNLKLELLPIAGADIVMREPKEENDVQ